MTSLVARSHSRALIDALLEWCECNCTAAPGSVTVVGLALLYGLNVHQIRCSRIGKLEPLCVTYPAARRIRDIADAPTQELRFEDPPWLVRAILALVASHTDDALVFRPRDRVGTPQREQAITRLAKVAGDAVANVVLTIGDLNATHNALIISSGGILALHGLGYSPLTIASYGNRRSSAIVPRRKR